MVGLRKPTLPTLIDAEPDWFDLVDFLGGVTTDPQIDATKILLSQGGSLLSTWRDESDPSKINAAKLLGNIALERMQTNILAAINAAGGIANANVAADAAIAKTKLAALGIVDEDVTGPIAKSKIDTTGTWTLDEIPSGVDAGKLQARDISSGAPADGQFLKWVAANNRWEPATM
jgi:hypothetical protein